MKTIKGTYRDNNYFEYEVNGKKYWVQGELEFLNKNIMYTIEISIEHSNFLIICILLY